MCESMFLCLRPRNIHYKCFEMIGMEETTEQFLFRMQNSRRILPNHLFYLHSSFFLRSRDFGRFKFNKYYFCCLLKQITLYLFAHHIFSNMLQVFTCKLSSIYSIYSAFFMVRFIWLMIFHFYKNMRIQ